MILYFIDEFCGILFIMVKIIIKLNLEYGDKFEMEILKICLELR